MTPDIQELKKLAEAARNVAPDVAYVRNQETGDLFEVRVSNFPPADIAVRKMAHGEDVVAEAAYGFSRSPDTILALIEALERQREAFSGPAAWLDSWAQHVGNCKGGCVCTCGLTLARTEAAATLKEPTDD